MSDYPPGGVLFTNDRKKSDKAPDYTGNLELSDEVLRDLVAQAKEGKTPKMELVGWKKMGKSGKGFLSLVGKKPWEPDGSRSETTRQKPKADLDDLPF
jgi:hypothetical protein